MSADHPLSQMISDLLVAGGGTIEAASEDAVLGWFPSPALAVTSSRRVQHCVDSFNEDLHSSAVGIGLRSMPVMTGETASSPAAIDLPELVRAGRIAVIGDLWQKLEEIPGLRLRPLKGSDRTEANIRELIWNPIPKRLPLNSSVTADQEGPTEHSRSTGTAIDLILTPPDVLEERRRRIWIYGGLACAAVLILTFSVLIVMVSRRNVAGRLAAPSVVSTAPQAQGDGAKPTVPNPTVSTKDLPSDVSPVAADPATAKSPAILKRPKQAAATPKSCAPGVFDRDIPNLLTLAKNDLGSGHYKQALREYEIVECLDHGNREASEGIARVHRAEALDR